ncbi:FKBP-type peptidyl-prolyl cis-trans isomerase [Halorientalis regularis]|jgi:FKBP-type peptidyl-prolyl cis-trans isomerase SlyD|uniref:peptidylprolyl isomerase n=1 Tax=Halorientalis regularis TaxID=660518 RepID=A0A1G7NRM5_9EURY|nr:peptidylprolyl isomerase [Halorientalis regularis]SDF76613.1 FKBP-type peptidyl-prolyl cis-trans isomerase SlyD [Halorientalis regularis]
MSDEAEADEAEQADDVANSEETTESEQSGLQAGDFVELDYTARTVEEGTIVDTTYPEVAEEEGLDEEDREFEPRTLVLGEEFLFEAVEEDIIGGEVGDSGTVEIPAAEAFGEFDEDDVRTVSVNKIPEDDQYPGAQVQIDGQQGRVETLVGGRARVDFNHPLAGEDIEYEYEVVGRVEDQLEQARSLFDMYLGMDLEMWIQTDEVEEEELVQPDEEGDEDDEPEPETEIVEVEKETLYIEANPQLSMNQQWMMQKQQICQQVTDLLGLDRVIIQEIIDGSGMGMGMGGMMGGMGGGEGDIEEALEDADVDADEIMEEIGGAAEDANE